MDFIQEGIILGVDLLILGVSLQEYFTCKRNIQALKDAPHVNIDKNLKNYVASQKDSKLPYAVIRGTVAPIGEPMHSALSPSVTGVVQVIKLKEHCFSRGFAGFWTEQEKPLHVSTNDIPFKVTNNGESVQIVNALSAAVLDMDVVYDNYEEAPLTVLDHLLGFFSGVRKRGFKTTEEVLRDGSFITAVGELEHDNNSLRLQPSAVGPLLLTSATKTTLIKKYQEAKTSLLFKICVCSAISAVVIGLIVRKLYLRKKREWSDREIREALERERRKRRARSRQVDVPVEQLCVVCSTNPKEIIILPCGHVCLCEDCSIKIELMCPVCRGRIDSRAAAFIT